MSIEFLSYTFVLVETILSVWKNSYFHIFRNLASVIWIAEKSSLRLQSVSGVLGVPCFAKVHFIIYCLKKWQDPCGSSFTYEYIEIYQYSIIYDQMKTVEISFSATLCLWRYLFVWQSQLWTSLCCINLCWLGNMCAKVIIYTFHGKVEQSLFSSSIKCVQWVHFKALS